MEKGGYVSSRRIFRCGLICRSPKTILCIEFLFFPGNILCLSNYVLRLVTLQ